MWKGVFSPTRLPLLLGVPAEDTSVKSTIPRVDSSRDQPSRRYQSFPCSQPRISTVGDGAHEDRLVIDHDPLMAVEHQSEQRVPDRMLPTTKIGGSMDPPSAEELNLPTRPGRAVARPTSMARRARPPRGRGMRPQREVGP